MIFKYNIKDLPFKLQFDIFGEKYCYYNDKTKEYYIHDYDRKRFFNLDGIKYKVIWNNSEFRYFNKKNNIHREDGPAEKFISPIFFTYCLDNTIYNIEVWSYKTNHLFCKLCGNFCKQKCL